MPHARDEQVAGPALPGYNRAASRITTESAAVATIPGDLEIAQHPGHHLADRPGRVRQFLL